MFNWLKRLWHGKNSSVAEERGEESQGRSKREGSSKLQGGNTKASSQKRRQSSKSKLPSKKVTTVFGGVCIINKERHKKLGVMWSLIRR